MSHITSDHNVFATLSNGAANASALQHSETEVRAPKARRVFIEDTLEDKFKQGVNVNQLPPIKRIITKALSLAIKYRRNDNFIKLFEDEKLTKDKELLVNLFYDACVNNNSELVDYLIAKYSLKNLLDSDKSAIREAAESGNLKLYKKLTFSFKPKNKDFFSDSLYAAAINGHVEVVKYLLDHELANAPSYDSGIIGTHISNTLHAVSASGVVGVAKLLLSYGGGHIINGLSGSFEQAIQNGHLGVVKEFLGSANFTFVDGRYYIYSAVDHKQVKILKCLLKHRKLKATLDLNDALTQSIRNADYSSYRLLINDSRVRADTQHLKLAIECSYRIYRDLIARGQFNKIKISHKYLFSMLIQRRDIEGVREELLKPISAKKQYYSSFIIRAAFQRQDLQLFFVFLNDPDIYPAAAQTKISSIAQVPLADLTSLLLTFDGDRLTQESVDQFKNATLMASTELLEILLRDPRVFSDLRIYELIPELAARSKNDKLKLLLEKSKVISSSNLNNVLSEALSCAAAMGHQDTVDLLLQDRRVNPKFNQFSALKIAVGNQYDLVAISIGLKGGISRTYYKSRIVEAILAFDSYTADPYTRQKVLPYLSNQNSLNALRELAALCHYYAKKLGYKDGKQHFLFELENHNQRSWPNHLTQFKANCRSLALCPDMISSIVDGALLPIITEFNEKNAGSDRRQLITERINSIRASAKLFVLNELFIKHSLTVLARFTSLWHIPNKRQSFLDRPLLRHVTWKKHINPHRISDYIIYELDSHQELANEGTLLSHCVGNGSYSTACANDETIILSFRKNDQPIATLELIKDLQGTIKMPDGSLWKQGQFMGYNNIEVQHTASLSPLINILEQFKQDLAGGKVGQAETKVSSSVSGLYYKPCALEKVTGVPIDRDPSYLLDYWLNFYLKDHKTNQVSDWLIPDLSSHEIALRLEGFLVSH